MMNTMKEERMITLNCDIHGKYKGTEVRYKYSPHKDFGEWIRFAECPVCESERIAKMRADEEATQKAYAAAIWETRLESANIGRRYWDATLDNWLANTSKQKNILNAVRAYIESFQPFKGKGLLMRGTVGTGKTHLAISALISVMNKGHEGAYYTMSRLLSSLRSCYVKDGDTEDNFYWRMKSYDLLVIDEVGIKTLSADEFNTLYRVIDERYADMRATILITNLDDKDSSALLSDRIIDRMKESFYTLIFDWDSYRGK